MDRKSVLYQGLMNSINTPENVYDPFFSNLSLMDLLNNLDCMIAWKNVHSVFMGGNRLAAKMAGFKNTDELINISDYELKSKVSEYADEFIAQDRFVIETGQSLDILGVHTYEDDITRIILTKKTPLMDGANKVKGVMYHSSFVKETYLVAISKLLFSLDIQCYLSKLDKQQSYFIQDTYEAYGLSRRESQCLFYLLRGKKSSVVAKLMGISIRTVEAHINHIKQKMDCKFLSEVVDKSIVEGYLFMLPVSCIEGLLLNA